MAKLFTVVYHLPSIEIITSVPSRYYKFKVSLKITL